MSYVQWVLDNYMAVGIGVLAVIGGLSAGLHAIAPFTSTTWDDSAAGWLDRIAAFLTRIIAPRKATQALDAAAITNSGGSSGGKSGG